MPKKTYIDMPRDYAVYGHGECSLAESCLHGIAFRELQKTEEMRFDAYEPLFNWYD